MPDRENQPEIKRCGHLLEMWRDTLQPDTAGLGLRLI